MLLAMLINHEFSFTEVLWTFSIYLEAVGYPAAAGAAAAHEERRHPDWELRVFARRVQSAVPAELDLPVPHRAGVTGSGSCG